MKKDKKTIVSKEIYIYKGFEHSIKKVWRKAYRELRGKDTRLYDNIQVYVLFYDMQGFYKLWLLDRRIKDNEKRITIVGNFRGWRK